ncbi:MAG: hypothetical protein K0Q91_378 [Fibrobacteria bacterium]|nr:hypothetical protein [Fibrobacteria bacterium]
MQNLIRLLFLAALAAAPAMAQHSDPLKTKAFSFGFNQLSLSGPYGGNIGGKIWLPGNRALALGLHGNSTGYSEKTPDSLDYDRTGSNYQLGVNVALQQHFDWSPGLSPYLTFGGSAGFSGSRDRYEYAFDTSSSRGNNFNAGLQAGFGLEYWFARRLSLSGQQMFSGSMSFGKGREDEEEKYDTRSYSVGLGTSSLTLNIYL